MLLAPPCVLLVRLSCLLDTIARISNVKLFEMIIRPITEGSEWPGYNLIIKSKGKVRDLSAQFPACILTSTNVTNTNLFSLSL